MVTTSYRLRYILVGASGTGKTTMASVLEQQLGLKRCITSTTRPPRPGEIDGVHYCFKQQLDPDCMFEHAVFGGYEYGISKEALKQGDFVILDPQGVAYYREHYPKPLTVIQLKRGGIEVDPERMARDRDAGFDHVDPDVVIRGETIEEMSANLISYITDLERKEELLMRPWLKELDQIDRDCVYRYEYLFGRFLDGPAEYAEIDSQVDEMILEWDSRKAFFSAYPELRKYAARENHNASHGHKDAVPSLQEKVQIAASKAAAQNQMNVECSVPEPEL